MCVGGGGRIKGLVLDSRVWGVSRMIMWGFLLLLVVILGLVVLILSLVLFFLVGVFERFT